jgi:hypothetical protein
LAIFTSIHLYASPVAKPAPPQAEGMSERSDEIPVRAG